MESDSQLPKEQLVQAVILPYSPPDDEIRLVDLWWILVRRRFVMGLAALAVFGCAVSYVLMTSKEYEATVRFLPPAESDIEPLHLGKLQQIDPEGVYAVFRKNLGSHALMRRLFDEQGLAQAMGNVDVTPPGELFESFVRHRISIRSQSGDSDVVYFNLIWGNRNKAVKLANAYTDLVERATAGELAKNLRQLIASRIGDLARLIASKRELEEQRRLDMIARLEEAATIAEQLGLKQPLNLSTQAVNVSTQQRGGQSLSGEKTALLDSGRMPLYFLGSKALRAEADIVRTRKSNDPFVSNLRDLEEELARLRLLDVEEEAVKGAVVDRAAYAPNIPIKPKTRMILSIGAVAAVLLGLISAFFAEFLSKAKKALRKNQKNETV